MNSSRYLLVSVYCAGALACSARASIAVRPTAPPPAATPPPKAAPPPPTVAPPPAPPPAAAPAPTATSDKILRIGADGKADNSFGKDAVAAVAARATLLSYDGAGGILVFARDASGAEPLLSVIRYTANGQVDSAFGGGKPVVLGPAATTSARSVFVDHVGRVLLLTTTKNAAGAETATVHRFVATGLDTNFAKIGSAPVKLGPGSDATAVAYDPGSARILVAGSEKSPPDKRTVFISKLRGDGSFENTFRTQPAAERLEPIRVMVDAVSRVYVVTNRMPTGSPEAGPSEMVTTASGVVAFRFGPNGTPDAVFGTNGVLTVEEPNKHIGVLDALIMPGGPGAWHPTQLVIGAWVRESKDVAGMKPIVMRFNDKGSLDSTFGSGGTVELTDAAATHLGRVSRVGRDGTGRVIAIGSYRSGTAETASSTTTTFVTRLTAAGTPDPTYGSGGGGYFATESFPPEIDPQGRVLLRAP